MVALIRRLRAETYSVVQIGGELLLSSQVIAGVVHGNPLRGSMYVLVADSVLEAVERALADRGKLWACAGDLATTLSDIGLRVQ